MEKKKENGCRANLHKQAQVWGGGVMSRVIAVTTAVVSRGNRQKSIRQGSSKVGLLDIHVSIKICRYINWDLLRLLEWPIGALICNNMLWQLTSQKYQHVCKYWFTVRESAQWYWWTFSNILRLSKIGLLDINIKIFRLINLDFL